MWLLLLRAGEAWHGLRALHFVRWRLHAAATTTAVAVVLVEIVVLLLRQSEALLLQVLLCGGIELHGWQECASIGRFAAASSCGRIVVSSGRAITSSAGGGSGSGG
jgi:hypothetical protein